MGGGGSAWVNFRRYFHNVKSITMLDRHAVTNHKMSKCYIPNSKCHRYYVYLEKERQNIQSESTFLTNTAVIGPNGYDRSQNTLMINHT